MLAPKVHIRQSYVVGAPIYMSVYEQWIQSKFAKLYLDLFH